MSSLSPPALTSVVLCADDYACNEAVSQGIVHLARLGRLSATSVMTLSPHWMEHAPALRELQGAIDVGVHLDWTSAFAQEAGLSQGLGGVIWRSLRKGWNASQVRVAIEHQLDAFERVWQSPPDHVDGHQHIQQFDGFREVLGQILVERYGQQTTRPWVRISQTQHAHFKGAFIAWMGANALRVWAQAHQWPTLSPLLGVYGFDGTTSDYARRMQGWLAESQACSQPALIMCHPALRGEAQDAIGLARANEFQYLASDDFVAHLRVARVQLTRGSKTQTATA